MTTRIDRNIQKMKSARASDTEIDQYLIAEGEGENCFPRIWRKPLAGTPPLTPQEIVSALARFDLEAGGHWQDKLEAQ